MKHEVRFSVNQLCKKIKFLWLFVLLLIPALGWAQTNPATASLPFTFNGATSIPSSMAIHRFGTSAGAIPTTRTTADGNADLPFNATANAGGHKFEGTSGVDGISILASSSQSAGAIVSEISTTGLSNITVSWVAWTVLDQTSYTNSIALQYRVGESGTWIDVDNPVSSVYTTSTIGRASGVSYTQTLPAGANNQPIVQVRWIYWVSGGASGSRDRLGIDNISISGSPACTTPTISLVNQINNTCFGTSIGSLDVTVSNGTALWNDGNTNMDRTGLAAGVYSITVTDGACSATASYTITQGNIIDINPTNNSPLCAGSDLNMFATPSGGSGTYTNYSWAGPNGFNSIQQNPTITLATIDATGTYTITVTDNLNCTNSTTITASVSSPANTASVSINATTLPICAGIAQTITATPVYGGSNPTYEWYLNNTLQASTSHQFTFTPQGGDAIYVKMTSSESCVSGSPATSAITTYTLFASPIITETITNVSCNGGNNGSIDLSQSGTLLPYSFLWNDGNTNEDRVNLAAGTYTVTVTNSSNCTASFIYTVTEPNSGMSAGSTTSNSPQCVNVTMQLSSTEFTGGTGTLMYAWTGPNGFSSNGLTANFVAQNISSGIYTITATDANNCTKTSTISVTANALPIVNANNAGPFCAGETIYLQGGNAGYANYMWQGPNGFLVMDALQSYAQNFDGLPNSGSTTWTDNTTLSNWYSQRTGTGTSIVSDAGSGTAGALYSYGSATINERALGTIGSSNAAAGHFAHGLLLQNATGQTVNDIKVSYTLEQWRSSAAAAHTINVYYKISSTPITSLTPNNNSGWNLIPGLALNSPVTGGSAGALNGNATANKVSASNVSIGSIALANNEYIMLKWEDPDHSGTDHGLAIDDVSVQLLSIQQNTSLANASNAMNGTYTITVTDVNSCSASATTNVLVNAQSGTKTLQTSCDHYIWPISGIDYVSGGTYTQTSLNTAGCLHTDTLELTITYSTSESLPITACNSYTWSANNITYTTSGTYTITSTNTAGCVHTKYLVLTIHPSVNTFNTIVECDTYTWPVNGLIYTASGNYTATTLSSQGCIDTSNLYLTINQSPTTITMATQCYSYNWPLTGVTYTTSGTYTYTQINAAGCVSTVLLNLTINQSTSTIDTVVSCDSYYWPVTNTTYYNNGTYTSTSINANGCIHYDTLTVIVDLSTTSSETVTECDNYVWVETGVMYTVSGTYTATSINALGCTHTKLLFLTINASTSSTQTAHGCDSYLWQVNGVTYYTNGNYTATTTNAAGCPHITTLNLSIDFTNHNFETLNACKTYTWPVSGLTYTQSGMYTRTFTNSKGCDSTFELTLNIYQPVVQVSYITECDSYTWTPQTGLTYTVSGVYYKTHPAFGGCTDTNYLHLTILQSTSENFTAVACDAFTWIANGLTYTQSGSYVHTSVNAEGCTLTKYLSLTINYNTGGLTDIASGCDFYTWPVNGQTYFVSGLYTYTATNASGCTFSKTLDLTIFQNTTSSQTESACTSYFWPVNNATYTASGNYTATLVNGQGCLHTAHLSLVISPNPIINISVTQCNSYYWPLANATYTASGTYTHTQVNASGCITTTNLNVTILQNTSTSLTASACNSYIWNSVVYGTSGIYTKTSLNTNGCLHTDSLILTINQTTSSNETVTVCDEYIWNGISYIASGNYAQTSINAAGCTHTTYLDLTVNLSTSSINIMSACASYVWNGNTYTTSGNYTYTTLNANGCTHTNILALSITNNTSNTSNVTACNSYTWSVNNTTYSNSGVYTHVNGCHTEILNLTLNFTTTNTIPLTVCDSFTWNSTGMTYTQSGYYTHTSLNANGCLQINILDLTVNHSSTFGGGGVFCDSYTWSCNNITYTQSGLYTCSYPDNNGCTVTEWLSLTINHSTASIQTETATTSYTWACNGITYTQSGTYTCTSLNSNGCTHTTTLYLTILTNTFGSESVTACNEYTWACNNMVYSVSGTYTCTYLLLSGATHTQTLYLTINPNTTSSSNVQACNSYTWNGVNYTISGTYTHTSIQASGCLHTATLYLTVHQSTSSSASITACDSYIWNGSNYTVSGTYTATSLNAAGCLLTETLYLSLLQSTSSSQSVTQCDTYTWNMNNQTYTSSGTYTHTSMNVVGCMHTEILNLTIIQSTTVTNNITACGNYVWHGTTYTQSGTYTFVQACVTEVLQLTILTTSTYSTSITANACYVWNLNGVAYSVSGMYSHTMINASAGCAETHYLHLTIVPGIILKAKVMLAGPYDMSTGLMHDSLRLQGIIPLTEPYSAAPYSMPAINSISGEIINPSLFSVVGNNAIVDWVFVELRDIVTPSMVLANIRALIQRDGDIVNYLDGTSEVFFPGVVANNYFVSIKHRNHLGIMSLASIYLSPCSSTLLDMTTSSPVATMQGNNSQARKAIGSIMAMWSADANHNKNVKYNGLNNDKDKIMTAIGGPGNINTTVYGYRMEDGNMDGKVRYNGIDNDRVLIINNVGISTPNNVIFQQTPN
ncbi:MAG: SprB repeat-containing protein [Bacteroidetes bacterium]|nr:SprB repeat-containing protein [Bacteroidota bacterium]